ncbi:hypothetical protein EVG20_g7801 [Dentipellis fragilis]|uniref:Uncharacterized protein n=1 Tax=Dentipellis fragilis TaxID=205917 RepID=A0A4Y9YB74_9AGAM|nr:hypothetical protein EVG20_g7801 [Dentipellis fragilis]
MRHASAPTVEVHLLLELLLHHTHYSEHQQPTENETTLARRDLPGSARLLRSSHERARGNSRGRRPVGVPRSDSNMNAPGPRRLISKHGSFTIDARDVPHARKELELEMRAIKLVMSSVRTRYNALAFVNRLPSEVLACIFDHFCDISMLDYAVRSTRAVVLTHVCHRWRIVAIDHPGLWSHILIGSRSTEEYLRRSRREPIIINHATRWRTDSLSRLPNGPRAEDASAEDLARIISQNLFRMQGFGLSGTFAEFTTILPALRGPVPILEKAILTISSWGSGPIPAHPLPSDLFSQSAPQLRHLRLDGPVAIPYVQHTRPPSPLRRSMPLLEVLQLVHVLPPPRLGIPWRSIDSPDQVVTLSRLREFVLTDTLRRCHLVLRHAAAAPITRYQIYCTDDREECDLLAPWLSAKVNTSPPIGMLDVTQRSEDVEIAAFSNGDRPPENKPLLQLRLEGPNDGQYALEEMGGLFGVLPLEHIQVLRISYDSDIAAFSNWPGIFCGCANLRHVSVDCEPDDGASGEPPVIDRLLAIDLSPPVAMTRTSPPFPSLISLTLRGIDFGHDVSIHDGFLAWLGRWGSFKMLVLRGSNISTALSDRLRALAFELDM